MDENGAISILFSAIKNKPSNQVTSTLEGTIKNMSQPQAPKLFIQKYDKVHIERIVSSKSPTVFENDNDITISSNPYGSSEIDIKLNKTRYKFTRNKIKTNKTFQLRMQNRTTHGNIINNNIRPQSAGILSKIDPSKQYSRIK
jgi:hypothetical protein